MISKRVSIPNAALDGALWAAYRRRDKIAVTEKLFRRSLARVASTTFRGRFCLESFLDNRVRVN